MEGSVRVKAQDDVIAAAGADGCHISNGMPDGFGDVFRTEARAVLGGVYKAAYWQAASEEHMVQSQAALKLAPRTANVQKTGAGTAPVPKSMWRGFCGPQQRKTLRLLRGLGWAPRVRTNSFATPPGASGGAGATKPGSDKGSTSGGEVTGCGDSAPVWDEDPTWQQGGVAEVIEDMPYQRGRDHHFEQSQQCDGSRDEMCFAVFVFMDGLATKADFAQALRAEAFLWNKQSNLGRSRFIVALCLVVPLVFHVVLSSAFSLAGGDLILETIGIAAAYDIASFAVQFIEYTCGCNMHHLFCRVYTATVVSAVLCQNGRWPEAVGMGVDLLLFCREGELLTPSSFSPAACDRPEFCCKCGRCGKKSDQVCAGCGQHDGLTAQSTTDILPSRGADAVESQMAVTAAFQCEPCLGQHILPTQQAVPSADLVDSESEGEMVDTSFFEVRALPVARRPYLTEQDGAQAVCRMLSQALRAHPTLPANPVNLNEPWLQVGSGCMLPLWHCAFAGCSWHGAGAQELSLHLDNTHAEQFSACRAEAAETAGIFSNMDLYEEAIGIAERDQIPTVGPSIDRRSIALATQRYNDDAVCSLVCFVCGQIKAQTFGANSSMTRQSGGWFANLGEEALQANLGWGRWEKHYGSRMPLSQYGPGRCRATPQGDWSCKVYLVSAATHVELFGCPEDWQCSATGSDRVSHTDEKGVLKLCKDCTLPVCRSCQILLATAGSRNNVPMALANDHWYGYVQDVIARYDARWIECACASLCWTTLITYQLEEPHGHLMNESMQGARGRTAARGNVFSFMMPWEDILKNLRQAQDKSVSVALPNDGAVLAVLVRVHIIGGSIDVTKHLRDVHLRVHVVLSMLQELIARGFPGYRDYHMDDIRQRARELYGNDEKAEVKLVM